MRFLLRALSIRVSGISMKCSMFVTLTLARLARRRPASRPRRRPARARYAYSGLRRIACLLMVNERRAAVSIGAPSLREGAGKSGHGVCSVWPDVRRLESKHDIIFRDARLF